MTHPRLSELAPELAEGQELRAVIDQAERSDIPKRCRAAVTEDDFVAIRKGEQFAQSAAHASDQGLDWLLAMRGAEEAGSGFDESDELLGRTLDGPAPKRPSPGLRSAGIRKFSHGQRLGRAGWLTCQRGRWLAMDVTTAQVGRFWSSGDQNPPTCR